jgi:multisubunit Na+/H+ antiporter MnhG subunit
MLTKNFSNASNNKPGTSLVTILALFKDTDLKEGMQQLETLKNFAIDLFLDATSILLTASMSGGVIAKASRWRFYKESSRKQ